MTAVAIVAVLLVAVQTFRYRREAALARTDELTGIANRRGFDEELARRGRRNRPVAAVFVDLDCLKRINDTHGHRVGDELLCRVAMTLSARTRRDDVVARLGGDEFAILLGDGSAEGAEALASDLSPRLADASIGWSAGVDAIEDADRRMYEAKRAKRAA